jgi:hypothetical protein
MSNEYLEDFNEYLVEKRQVNSILEFVAHYDDVVFVLCQFLKC